MDMWILNNSPTPHESSPYQRYPNLCDITKFPNAVWNSTSQISSDFTAPTTVLTAPWPQFLALTQSARATEWKSPGELYNCIAYHAYHMDALAHIGSVYGVPELICPLYRFKQKYKLHRNIWNLCKFHE